MELEIGRVGELLAGKGAEEQVRLGPYLDLIVSELHGKLFEAARVGRVFAVAGAAAGFAAAATHVSPLAAGTGTPVIGIYNPVGSGRLASILEAIFVAEPVAATGVGVPVWNVMAALGAPGITQATVVTPVPQNAGQSGPSAIKGYSNVALTGSALMTFLRFLAPYGSGIAAAPSATTLTLLSEDVGGGIIVPPGGFAGLALSAAGTTFNVSGAIVYEELDLAAGTA